LHPGSDPGSAGTVVTIDGPAGSGKSTLARLLADRLGFRFLDSGAMYRALTLKALRGGVDPADEDATAALLRRTEIRLADGSGGQRAYLDGEDVSEAIRGPAVTAAVSRVAAHRRVREGMVERQRAFVREGRGRGVVVEGRDIGTVVFPDAAVKFFLDAVPEERARRRAAQTGGPAEVELEAMRRRDAADAGRAVAPLRAAGDAEAVDTTGRTVEQVLEDLLRKVRGRLKGA
jgi:cytidylate kinase